MAVLTLFQAEWCPYSSAVRELLTELGVSFVARQVEPWPEQRTELRERTGGDTIPTLVTDDGEVHQGTRAIFRWAEAQTPWEHAGAHRQRFLDHRDARESDAPGQLVERAHLRTDGGPPEQVAPAVRDNEEASRYELLLGDRLIGLAAYRRRPGVTAFTHTEVDEACEGRGYGTVLVRAALDDTRRRGDEIVALCPFVQRGYDAG